MFKRGRIPAPDGRRFRINRWAGGGEKVSHTQNVSPNLGLARETRGFSRPQFIRTVRFRRGCFCSLHSGSGAPCPVGASDDVVAVLLMLVLSVVRAKCIDNGVGMVVC